MDSITEMFTIKYNAERRFGNSVDIKRDTDEQSLIGETHMMREALTDLSSVLIERYLTCRDRTLRITLNNGTRFYVEYVSDELKKCRVYGADLSAINIKFDRYKTVDTVYNNIPVDVLCNMFDELPDNSKVISREIKVI